MKFLSTSKDGGPESTVWAHWLCEIKWLFSIVLLRFENGTRDAYHSHAFNSISWVLSGGLVERHINGEREFHLPSPWPVFTWRNTTHKVQSLGRTWALSFRGPWADTWKEVLPGGEEVTLASGRQVIPVDVTA